MRRMSLRLRLFLLVLTPLILMSVLLGFWRINVAQNTAEEFFDRSLLAAALAISRDVTVSEGDAMSSTTRDLIRDASGGEVFYHVTGPNGIYITGYASPPVSLNTDKATRYAPHLFEAIYRGDKVRVLQVTERVTIQNLTGDATVTVWQRLADRNAFANQLALRATSLMGMLIVTLGLVVWFGVALGLRPLIDLQNAIAERTPDDLSRIMRPVPAEAQGIVRTLNRLFGKVEQNISGHQTFISDAAHQLRNPAAAVQSMAEAVRFATNKKDRDQRIEELIAAARSSARVAEQLLSLDRLQQPLANAKPEKFDLSTTTRQVCAEAGPVVLSQDIDFELIAPDQAIFVAGDEPILAEALKNLIDNAVKHGGNGLSSLSVWLVSVDNHVLITVRDDGKGLTPEQSQRAFSRFSQLEPSTGSGLGLAIAKSVAERHGGVLSIDDVDQGASLTMRIPLAG